MTLICRAQPSTAFVPETHAAPCPELQAVLDAAARDHTNSWQGRIRTALNHAGFVPIGRGLKREAYAQPLGDRVVKLGCAQANGQEWQFAHTAPDEVRALLLAPDWISEHGTLPTQPRATLLYRDLVTELKAAKTSEAPPTPRQQTLKRTLQVFLQRAARAGLHDLNTQNVGLHAGEWRLFDLHLEGRDQLK